MAVRPPTGPAAVSYDSAPTAPAIDGLLAALKAAGDGTGAADPALLREAAAALERLAEGRVYADTRVDEQARHVDLLEQIAGIGSWEIDLATDRIYWSREQRRIHGFDDDRAPQTHTGFMAMVHPDDRAIINEGMAELAKGEPVTVEFRVVRPDGETRLLQARGQMVAAADGQFTRVVGTSLDVTERRATERALRASEESYRTIFQGASDGMFLHDMETGAILDVNEAACDLMGYSADELKAIGLQGVTATAEGYTVDRAWEYANRALAGEPQRFEWLTRHKDGHHVWVEMTLRRVVISGADRILAISRGINDRKAAEAALRASEESYRTIFQSASDAMWLHDVDTGAFLEVNSEAVALLGYSVEEQKALGMPGISVNEAPYDGPAGFAKLRLAAAGLPQRFEWPCRDKKGRTIWTEVRLRRVTIGGVDRILAAGRDINDRKSAEAALRRAYEELEQRVVDRTAELAANREALLARTRELDAVFQALPDLYLRMTTDGTILDCRGAMIDALSVPPAELIGKRLRALLPDEVCDRFNEVLAAAAPGALATAEYQLVEADAVREYEARFFPLGDGTRICLVRDITERKQGERALQEREEHFRRLIENSSDQVMIVDTSGAITYIGPAVERLLGYSPESVLGMRPTDLVHPDDVPHVMQVIGEVAKHPGETYVLEYRMRHKDGSWRVFENVARTLNPDSTEAGLVANCRDITERRAFESALREREEYFRRLIENSSDQVMVFDTTGAISYSGPSVQRILGYTADEMVGMRPDEIVHPDDLMMIWERIQHIAKHPGETFTTEYRVRHKNGEYRLLEAVARTLSNDGPESGIVANCRDITERKEIERVLRERDEQFRRVIENTSDFVMMVDRTAAITYVAPSVTQMLGYEPGEMLGMRPADTVHVDDLPHVEQDFRWILEHPGEPLTSTFRIRHKDGTYRILENRGRTMSSTTGEEGVVAFGRDITERERAAAALERAKEEAERANKAKSEFLSRMSHELRTPMNSILGFGQLLARTDLPAQQLKSVQHILKAGRHLLHLINEVLEIARIEAGRENFSLEPVALASVLQEAYGLVRPLAQQRNVELREGSWPRGAFVQADRQRFVQVLLNLLSNAIKYNRRDGGYVSVSCEETGDRWAIRIEDAGHGIPSDRVEQLFTPFARLGAEQTEIEGTGLGLALSQRLCEAMGGALALERTGETGSVFRIELCGAEDPRRVLEETGAVAVVSAPHQDATLLYIEDNLANLSLVETILLSRPGWRTVPALQGQLGVELARQYVPDVVLLDLHLPDIPGDEVLRRLRADPRTAKIPVIVVSADATTASLERLRSAGADAYLTKPLDVDEFLRAVERFLKV